MQFLDRVCFSELKGPCGKCVEPEPELNPELQFLKRFIAVIWQSVYCSGTKTNIDEGATER